MKGFRRKKVQACLDDITDVINKYKLKPLESAYMLINLGVQLGEALYDRPYVNPQLVKADFKLRPTLGAGLILSSDALRQMIEMLSRESPPDDQDWEQALPNALRKVTGKPVPNMSDVEV